MDVGERWRAELEGLGTAELVELVQAGAETLSRDQLVHAAFAIINVGHSQ
jgi:hypothetical protein